MYIHYDLLGCFSSQQLILALKLNELEQFENFAPNYQKRKERKAEKSENDTKIKLMPLPSNKKGVSGGDVVLKVKLNFKGCLLSCIFL